MKSICQAIENGKCDARIEAVISDKQSAKGLQYAREKGFPTAVISLKNYSNRSQWNIALADKVAEFNPELVVLAGFMRVVNESFLEHFPGKVINLHPALLPLFPGTDGPGMAINAGVRLSGCTVHVVDVGVDTGPIIAQAAVRVNPHDDRDRLHERIQIAEHRLLPFVIDQIAKKNIELIPKLRIHIDKTDDVEILYSLNLPDDSL